MADIAITAANVIPSANANRNLGVAGVALAQGDVLFMDSTDANKLKKADADLSALASTVVGIAENAAAVGQYVSYITKDPQLAIGGTVAAGALVILSATAGKIAPSADAASGWYVTVLGVGVGSNKINFNPVVSAGVPVP